jgi:hypothetical protein
MMREVVIVDKAAWDRRVVLLAEAIREQYAKGYGFKLVRNEDGGVVDSIDELTGALVLPMQRLAELLDSAILLPERKEK